VSALVYFSALEALATYKRLITASEVAKILGRHKLTIYRLAKSGHLPHFRSGTSMLFDPKAIADYLHAREVR